MALPRQRDQQVRARLTLGRLAALAALASLCFIGPSVAAPPQPASSGARFGSRVVFHGWSKSSDYVAYTRIRHRPGDGPRAKPIDQVQRMHRRIEGGELAGFGKMVGGDVESWALQHDYVVDPAPQTRTDGRTVLFRVAGREYVLKLLVGRRVGWELRAGDQLLRRHYFDSIYLDFTAELYVAPNARQAALIMHLDAGWVVDAALYPVGLLPPKRSVTDDEAPHEPAVGARERGM